MTISIDMIKALRAETFAPLWDCKEALVEANGDMELAKEILKKKWAVKADKKSGRLTENGVVKFVTTENSVIGVKLLCETDFVARNDEFNHLVDQLIEAVANWEDDNVDVDSVPEELMTLLTTMVKDQTATIGEAMSVGYVYKNTGKAYVYNHNGAVSAIIFYTGEDESVAKSLALQVAAMNPQYISLDDVPSKVKDELRAEVSKDESLSNKPEEIRDQIVEGKVKKSLQADVLLEQASIVDQSKKVKDLLPQGFSINAILRVAI